jgi:hypothetical protein
MNERKPIVLATASHMVSFMFNRLDSKDFNGRLSQRGEQWGSRLLHVCGIGAQCLVPCHA